MRKICVFTGTRAEYGLLAPLMADIERSDDLQLQVLVSGAHLAPEFGLTYRQIEADGFTIAEKVEMLLSSDTPAGMAKSAAIGMLGIGESLNRLRPDLLVLLGDRYEVFAAAGAAALLGIPVAHLHGGEVTEGAVDDSLRHAVTKLSYLHFVAAEDYRRRVIQLGESPERVFHVGALGVEALKNQPLLERAELARQLGFAFGAKTVLVTFHPATREPDGGRGHLEALLEALRQLSEAHILFTLANADSGGRDFNRMVEDFVRRHPERSAAFASLGQARYLSALATVDAVVGNSSSGIIEAPSFGTPTVNIGDRQKGRVRADSVLDCRGDAEEILQACRKALTPAFKDQARRAANPYAAEGTCRRIVEVLQSARLTDTQKPFFDLPPTATDFRP